MASRADAWLIHLPGMDRRHEVFTAEQLIQDLSNLDDLVSTVQDSQDDSFSGREKNSLSLFRIHRTTALADAKRTLSVFFLPVFHWKLC